MENNYFELPPLLDEGIIKRASRFGSAELCDGMKGMGVPNDGCLAAEILPIEKNMRMVGTACTVETKDGDNFPIHVAIYQGKPGYVLMIDGKACQERTYLGDLMGAAAKAIGFNGIVCDGFVRDRLGLEELGMPIFSRGFMQRTPSKKGPGKINTPITCGGVEVHPGDLVLGDADGVTVVPKDLIEAVLEKAEEKLEYEKNRRIKIAEYAKAREEDKVLPDLAPGWVREMLGK